MNPKICIDYIVSDTEKYKDLLLQNAIEDAMHKVKILTKAINLELRDIVLIIHGMMLMSHLILLM